MSSFCYYCCCYCCCCFFFFFLIRVGVIKGSQTCIGLIICSAALKGWDPIDRTDPRQAAQKMDETCSLRYIFKKKNGISYNLFYSFFWDTLLIFVKIYTLCVIGSSFYLVLSQLDDLLAIWNTTASTWWSSPLVGMDLFFF